MLRKLQKTSTASDVIVIVETFDTLKSRFIRDKAVWRTKLWFSYRSIKVVLHGTIRMIWFVWLLFGFKRFDLRSLQIVYNDRQVVHRVKTSDNEWQRMTTSGTTSDNEWQRVTTSGTTSDNEWQRVTTSSTTSDNKWQRVTTSGHFG